MPQATPRLSPPSTPQAPVAAAPSGDVSALIAQLTDLSIQDNALRAESRALTRQLGLMRSDNPARAAVQQQHATVGVKMADVEGKMAQIQGRLAQIQNVAPERISQTGQLLPPAPPPSFRRGADPDMIIGMSFVLAMCFVLPVSIGLAKRLWKGRPQAPAQRMDDVAPRLDRLEQAMDSIAIEIERISEGQRFVTRILAERPAQAPVAQASVANQQNGAAQDEKPVLALGAGPAEPIRVNERQGVKQAITPH